MQENPELSQVIEGLKFSESESKSLMNLLAAFVMLDGNFSDEEDEFLKNFCQNNKISYDNFIDYQEGIFMDGGWEKVCNDEIINLANMSFDKKEIVLAIMYDLSLSDNFLHLNEKKVLQDISTFWGINVVFGKGQLEWTEDQRSIINLSKEQRVIVNAAPGSGKTAVACARITNLIDGGIEPSKIWLVSFTRTATQELRDRISLFSDTEQNILGVKIATIDSRAWNVRFGFREEEVKKLFQGYDTNINEAIKIIEKNKEELEEFFEDFEHIVIDEAQDITEPRTTFINNLIEILPETCGVTIFGDKAQAIYGFTNDEENSELDDAENLMEFLEKNNNNFNLLELKKIHRTDDTELIKFIDQFRMDVLIDENHSSPEELKKQLVKKEFRNSFDENSFDTLFLYRKRSEVLRQLAFGFDKNTNFRLRLSGLPVVVRPWIAEFFNKFKNDKISKDEFLKNFQEYFSDLKISYDSKFTAYERLKSVAGNDKEINVVKLKEAITRKSPPVELCVPDIGFKGPIIGTIHSSKGRQADNVVLNLSKYTQDNPEKSKEETKIIFVGASRAKSNLKINDTQSPNFAKNLSSGRTYNQVKSRYSHGRRAQVEIGRDIDYDIFSIVSRKYFTDSESINMQNILNNINDKYLDALARADIQNDYRYRIYVKEQNKIHEFGYFNEALNDDLFRLKRSLGLGSRKGIPKEINFLKLIGVRSVSISENDPNFQNINPTFQRSKIWNVPVILGYVTLSFF